MIAQDSVYPKPLVEWLNIIDVEGYRTLAATDQNRFYFAVILGDNCKFLFSAFPHESSQLRSFTTIVEIVDGTNLQDLKSPPPLPPAIKREIKDGSDFYGSAFYGSAFYGSAFYGSAEFPVRLREHNETKIRVRYVEELENEPDRELYNQVIVLPLKLKEQQNDAHGTLIRAAAKWLDFFSFSVFVDVTRLGSISLRESPLHETTFQILDWRLVRSGCVRRRILNRESGSTRYRIWSSHNVSGMAIPSCNESLTHSLNGITIHWFGVLANILTGVALVEVVTMIIGKLGRVLALKTEIQNNREIVG